MTRYTCVWLSRCLTIFHVGTEEEIASYTLFHRASFCQLVSLSKLTDAPWTAPGDSPPFAGIKTTF